MTDDKFYEELSNLINGAFDGVFGRKTEERKIKPVRGDTRASLNVTTDPAVGEIMADDLSDFVAPDKEHFPNLYESIEDYTTQTGKRFRMTKEQKSRELTREQAFKEMYLGDN